MAKQDAKARGGYYTPAPIAQALAKWISTGAPKTIWEPSAGDGSLVAAIARACPRALIQANELVETEAQRIRALGLANVHVDVGDSLAWYTAARDGTYDAVVGNPPFIRYQSFPESHREQGFGLMREVGLNPNRLTNAWAPFVVAATRALRVGGRLALVVPAEIMQVTYAAELREYLARSFSELTIVTFEKLVFEGIQQETVLLLGVRGNGQDSARIGWLELEDMADLHPTAIEMTEHKPAQLNHARDKWTRYYLSRPELDLLQAFELCGQFSPLSDIAQVDVGVVTGRNEFFVLRPSQAAELGLTEHCVPLVGRSAQIPGLLLRKADWAALADEDAKCLLLQLGSNERSMLDPAALAYVERGERLGLDEGYKCRIRKPRWWRVPSAYSPDAFLLRQINDAPRIVLNAANCTSTDTIHRVRVNPGTNTEALAVASINSVTLAFSEILGRSYGGGVLELEPSEADALPFPILRGGLGDALPEVNGVLIAEGIRSASRMVDALVAETLGLPLRDFERASAIWATLSRRRVNRKPSSRVARLVA